MPKCTVVGILFFNWLILNYYKWVTNLFSLLSRDAEQFLRYAFEKFNFTRLVFGNSTFSQKILMVKVTKYLVTNLEMSKKITKINKSKKRPLQFHNFNFDFWKSATLCLISKLSIDKTDFFEGKSLYCVNWSTQAKIRWYHGLLKAFSVLLLTITDVLRYLMKD